MLYRYLEGNLSTNEKRKFESHLNSCPHCFSEMSSLIRNSQFPASAEEEVLISKLITRTPEQQAAKMVSLYHQLELSWHKKIARFIKQSLKNPFQTVKDFQWQVVHAHTKLKPALIGLIVILTIVIGGGYQYYQTTYQVLKSERLLKKNVRVFIEDARLSGGYASQGISMLLDQTQDVMPYLKTVKDQLISAIHHGSSASKARILLAHAYIIGRQFSQADSVLATLTAQSEIKSAVLNDIGVLYYQQKKSEKAAEYFQAAINLDENLLEAQYNLALIKMKLGKAVEARLIVENYLQKEKDKEWHNAAEKFLKKLKTSDSMR